MDVRGTNVNKDRIANRIKGQHGPKVRSTIYAMYCVELSTYNTFYVAHITSAMLLTDRAAGATDSWSQVKTFRNPFHLDCHM